MKIGKHAVVSFEYTLKDALGQVIDSSVGQAPFAYIQGTGSIIPGLERAMEGRSAPDAFSAVIKPEDGYGVRDEELVQEVPRALFDTASGQIEVGMQFQTPTEAGFQTVTVVSVTPETVRVDGNHPLAGQALSFDIKIIEVRSASADELAHGHVHGPDDHHH
ncbi:MAG: peptidylprolyl isomerase [Gammaproteobacteria bacterium]|nr:peptidylprolyl isomerase [Gammaproteobacteria bacterium]